VSGDAYTCVVLRDYKCFALRRYTWAALSSAAGSLPPYCPTPVASRAARATMSRGEAMAAASSPPTSPSAVTVVAWAR